MSAPTPSRRLQAVLLNRAIDRALEHPAGDSLREVMALVRTHGAAALADRARRRAARLSRRHPRRAAVLEARDALILRLYAAAAAKGWFSGWCDGSSPRTGRGAGIGGLILDPHGEVIARFARVTDDLTPLSAEIAALTALLDAAVTHGARRIRIHTDCSALIHLWQARGDDPRLAAASARAAGLGRMQLCLVPRRHNRPADRLARGG